MDDETADLCDKTYRELFMQNNKPGIVKLFPHVRETIAELYAMGIIITVASSRGRDTLVSFLDEMGLMMYISKVVSSQDVEQAKPAPDMVLALLKRMNLKEDEVLVVGDTTFDIDMGNSAGCKTVAVTYGNHSQERLMTSHPTFVIEHFSKLANLLFN